MQVIQSYYWKGHMLQALCKNAEDEDPTAKALIDQDQLIKK
jgi:hypothetical protein